MKIKIIVFSILLNFVHIFCHGQNENYKLFERNLIKVSASNSIFKNPYLNEGRVFKIFIGYETSIKNTTFFKSSYSYMPKNALGFKFIDFVLPYYRNIKEGYANSFEIGIKRYFANKGLNNTSLYYGLNLESIVAFYYFNNSSVLRQFYLRSSLNLGVHFNYRSLFVEIEPFNIGFVNNYNMRLWTLSPNLSFGIILNHKN